MSQQQAAFGRIYNGRQKLNRAQKAARERAINTKMLQVLGPISSKELKKLLRQRKNQDW